MKSNFVEYHIFIIDILHKNYGNENYTTQGCQLSRVHLVGDFFSLSPRQVYEISLIMFITNLFPVEYTKIDRNLPHHESNALYMYKYKGCALLRLRDHNSFLGLSKKDFELAIETPRYMLSDNWYHSIAGVSSFHAYQNKYHHPKYDVTVTQWRNRGQEDGELFQDTSIYFLMHGVKYQPDCITLLWPHNVSTPWRI